MSDLPDPAPSADPLTRRPAPVVLGLIVLFCAVEAVLEGADLRLWGTVRWRSLAYQNAGFWAGLLWGWKPNYPAQPAVMFLSYSFLHAGLWHLAGNMATLAVLGGMIRDRIRTPGFLALWTLSALGGGLAFGLISRSAQPMVGTSGALFGLVGALLAWEAQNLRAAGQSLWPVAGWVLGLVVLNLAFWWLQNGALAWETHLGGFLAGGIWGLLDRPQPPRLEKMRS
jgi:membrane associated rhomboid family serine protease